MPEHKMYLTVAREKRKPQNDGYMNPDKALEIVKNIRPKGFIEEDTEIKILVDIRDQIYKKIEMLQYEANGIDRAIKILLQC